MRAAGDGVEGLTHMRPRLRVASLAFIVVGGMGCAALGLGSGRQAIDVKPPNVSIAEVRMVDIPSNKELASYYCSQYLGPLICRAFGPVPSISDIRFAFDVELALRNQSPTPLPVVQSLFAFTAFPGEPSAANLGAVCLSFCENPDRCEQDADACTSDDPEIHDAKDFVDAAAGFLFSIALWENRFSDLRVRTIPPDEELRMVVRLGIDPTQMVDLIAKVAKGDIERIKEGRLPELAIPYQIEGTTWVAIESLGRLASAFGPVDGRWALR